MEKIELQRQTNGMHYDKLDKEKMHALAYGGYRVEPTIVKYFDVTRGRVYDSILGKSPKMQAIRGALEKRYKAPPAPELIPILWLFKKPNCIRYILLESRKFEDGIYAKLLELAKEKDKPETEALLFQLVKRIEQSPAKFFGKYWLDNMTANWGSYLTYRETGLVIVESDVTDEKGNVDLKKLQVQKAKIINDAIHSTKRLLASIAHTPDEILDKTPVDKRANAASKLMEKIHMLTKHMVEEAPEEQKRDILDLLDETIPARQKDIGYADAEIIDEEDEPLDE